MSVRASHNVLPGFNLTLGYTITYLSLIVLIPLAAVFIKTASLSVDQIWATISAHGLWPPTDSPSEPPFWRR